MYISVLEGLFEKNQKLKFMFHTKEKSFIY